MLIDEDTLKVLEHDVIRVNGYVIGSDLDGVEMLNELDRVRYRVYSHALDLIGAAREFNHLSGPDGDAYNYARGSNDSAIMDYKLPAFVRGFLSIRTLNATCTEAIREAGYMPKLYGRYKGLPVRVVMVSRLGDIGISREDKEHGYFTRCSIYDVTGYATTMPSSKLNGDGAR